METGKEGCVALALIFAVCIALLSLGPIVNWTYGVDGFGPVKYVYHAKVISKHVDSGKHSHYMVTTDCGTFVCDNGFLLGIWNADSVYGNIEIGNVYVFETKGNEVLGWLCNDYPYILKVEKDEAR